MSRARRRYYRTAERIMRDRHNAAVDAQRVLLPWWAQRNVRAALVNRWARRQLTR